MSKKNKDVIDAEAAKDVKKNEELDNKGAENTPTNESDDLSPVGVSFEEIEPLLNEGKAVALNGWGGYWKFIESLDLVIVVTKDNEVFDTPDDQYKDIPEWKVVEETEDQKALVEKYVQEIRTRQNNDKLKTKVVGYRQGHGVSVKFLDKPSTIIKILTKMPPEIKKSYSLITEDGRVFDLLKNSFTNETIKL